MPCDMVCSQFSFLFVSCHIKYKISIRVRVCIYYIVSSCDLLNVYISIFFLLGRANSRSYSPKLRGFLIAPETLLHQIDGTNRAWVSHAGILPVI